MSGAAREGGSGSRRGEVGPPRFLSGWASGGHGALPESRAGRCDGPGALALWRSLHLRAAERRARHYRRELERIAGGRMDDRIVSRGRWSRVPDSLALPESLIPAWMAG